MKEEKSSKSKINEGALVKEKVVILGCYFDYLPISYLAFCSVYLARFKEFKEFCTGSCTPPSLKGTNTFWKLRGIIE